MVVQTGSDLMSLLSVSGGVNNWCQSCVGLTSDRLTGTNWDEGCHMFTALRMMEWHALMLLFFWTCWHWQVILSWPWNLITSITYVVSLESLHIPVHHHHPYWSSQLHISTFDSVLFIKFTDKVDQSRNTFLILISLIRSEPAAKEKM